MNKYSRETAVGVFVLLGLLCVAYLTVKLGRMELLDDKGYTVTCRFASITGLRVGAEVEIAGVPVGRVASIRLDREHPLAVVGLRIGEGVKLTDDVIASIKTSGLIGDKYVKLAPGGSSTLLADGDEITETESSIDIESLISKYVFGGV